VGKRRTALGRGLDALIPARARDSVHELNLEDIVPDRSQPRQRFSEAELDELADSIRVHGLLQPLVVSGPDERGKHRLIIGERRWQAAKKAGLTQVPVMERDAGTPEALEMALVENLQRQDLDPLEAAAAFDRLISRHGLTQEEVARRVGRSRPAVANSLRLLSLPTKVRDALIAGQISEGHARALLAASNPGRMEELLRRVIALGLNVRQTEQLVTGSQSPSTPRQAVPPSAEVRELEDRLQRSLGTKVSLMPGRKRGRIVIEYYSQEDLSSLVERLLQERD